MAFKPRLGLERFASTVDPELEGCCPRTTFRETLGDWDSNLSGISGLWSRKWIREIESRKSLVMFPLEAPEYHKLSISDPKVYPRERIPTCSSGSKSDRQNSRASNSIDKSGLENFWQFENKTPIP